MLYWQVRLYVYGLTQIFINDVMAKYRAGQIETNPELSPEIQMKLRKLKMLEEVASFQKAIEPCLEELREPRLGRSGRNTPDDTEKFLDEGNTDHRDRIMMP